MLLRHKKTGNVYAYHKVLVDSGDYEAFEAAPVVVQPKPEPVKQRRRKAAQKINGETNGTNAQ